MSAYFSSFTYTCSLRSTAFPQKNILPRRLRCYLSLSRAQLGTWAQCRFCCRKNACPQPGSNAPAASGYFVLFEIQKPIGFGQVPCRYTGLTWPEEAWAPCEKQYMKTALEERSNLGQPFTAWNQNRWDHFGLNFTLSLPSCITASQLVPKFKTLRCWYLSQPRKPLSQLEFYDWRKGGTSRTLMGNAICGPSSRIGETPVLWSAARVPPDFPQEVSKWNHAETKDW